MTLESAIKWLEEAAKFFENRPTGGEDIEYWANVKNSQSAKKIAALLKSYKP